MSVHANDQINTHTHTHTGKHFRGTRWLPGTRNAC